MHEAISPPGPGTYEILSGGIMTAGQTACMRPGRDPLLVVFPATPWNAMNNWTWEAAPGGTGFTLTSDNGQVLVYLPNEGLNVRMMPPSHIGDPGAAWLPVFAGQNVFFAIVPAVDQTLALTISDGGPPWTVGQFIDAEPFDPDNVSPPQAWAFVALGESRGSSYA